MLIDYTIFVISRCQPFLFPPPTMVPRNLPQQMLTTMLILPAQIARTTPLLRQDQPPSSDHDDPSDNPSAEGQGQIEALSATNRQDQPPPVILLQARTTPLLGDRDRLKLSANTRNPPSSDHDDPSAGHKSTGSTPLQ